MKDIAKAIARLIDRMDGSELIGLAFFVFMISIACFGMCFGGGK